MEIEWLEGVGWNRVAGGCGMEGGPIPKFWPGFLCTPTWSVWGYLLSRRFGFGPSRLSSGSSWFCIPDLNPGRLGGPKGMPGIEPRTPNQPQCKADSFPPVLSLWPLSLLLFDWRKWRPREMKSLEFSDLGAESRWEPLSSCWDPDSDPALCSLQKVEWKTHLHAHPHEL